MREAPVERHLSVVNPYALPAAVRDGATYFVDGLLAGPSRAYVDEHIRARASYFEEDAAAFQG